MDRAYDPARQQAAGGIGQDRAMTDDAGEAAGAAEATDPESFPRRYARTARFTAGAPRGFQVSGDGRRVAFTRSASGSERATALWVLDADTGAERMVADPVDLLAGGGEQLTDVERARRERMRESGAGITSFALDDAGRTAVFALSSRLFVADLVGAGPTRELAAAGAVVDPRLSPDGSRVAYVSGGALHVVVVEGGADAALAEPESADVSYGLAEFAAAEELERYRGHWWSPASDAVLVERADVGKVQVWHVADPEHPEVPPAEHRYPVAGSANADVTLWLLRLDGGRAQVRWDHEAYEYLSAVTWTADGDPLLQVLSRRQDRALILAVDPSTGQTRVVREQSDPAWVDVVPGTPTWIAGGALVSVDVVEDRYALCVDADPVSPPGVQVRRVQPAGDGVLVHATHGLGEDRVYTWSAAAGWEEVSDLPGSYAAVGGPGLLVLATSHADVPRTTYRVVTAGGGSLPVRSNALDPSLVPRPRLMAAGPRSIPTALLLPTGWAAGDPALPVLMDPYGGPHHGLVHTAARGYLESQWWADQGFAVVVADGRGTPGTPSWEREVRYDLAGAPLADQVGALHAVAAAHPGVLDLARVGIRGWSFGGYLAGLAVLSRPDVFHTAIAGAPVTQWRLYDTAYTERYLGLPDEHPEAYSRGDLVELAAGLTRPLLLIHGLADDNVAAANSLRLSSALLAAGRAHTFLPLSGVTHMTPQEVVAENLLLLQLDFLRRSLDV
jgi:dipeptidyl-peptidase-4